MHCLSPTTSLLNERCTTNDFHILPIEPKHTAVLTTLPLHHRDPFNRLLVARTAGGSHADSECRYGL